MGWTEPSSMANDRAVPANRTSPRQQVQRDHAGVDVVFRLWQCDKENHGWREGPSRDRSLPSFRSRWPGLHPPAKSDSNEKRIQLCTAGGDPLRTLAALKAPLGESSDLSGASPKSFLGRFHLAGLATRRCVHHGWRAGTTRDWSTGFAAVCGPRVVQFQAGLGETGRGAFRRFGRAGLAGLVS